MRARRRVAAGAALVAIVVLAYAPALRAGFVWDDENLTENPHLRSAAGLRALWLEPGATTQYYPLVFTSFWIEHALFGLDPRAYHATNILLHAGCALLVWRLLALLGAPAAWTAAAVFALHPVQVESVAWVTERKNVLSGLFFLAAAIVYLGGATDALRARGPRERRRVWLLALGLYAAALLSKVTAVTLPAVLLIVVAWKRGRVRVRDAAPLLPMGLLALPIGLATAGLERRLAEHLAWSFDASPLERVLLGGRALWFYAGKLVWPDRLAFVYPRWELDAGAAWQYAFPLGAVAAVAALFALRRRIGLAPLVAALCFAINLSPVLGALDVYFYRFSYVADHWQYLACIGPLALLVGAGATGLSRAGVPRFAPAVAAALLLALGALTWRQSQTFRDPETLWRHSLRVNPESAMVHDNLGLLLAGEGRDEEAIVHYRRALGLQPDNAWAHHNLALGLSRLGDLRGAVHHAEQAVRLFPTKREFYESLRTARRRLARQERAERRRARQQGREGVDGAAAEALP